jgi:hypothetical protein
MTERRAPRVEPDERAEPRGFRPASRRRSRIVTGSVLAAIAIGGNVALYTSLDDTTEVLQLVDDVRAGEVVTSDDLRIVEVDVDPTVPVVKAADIGRVVNQYARVFLPSGSLIFDGLVQSEPLVSVGAAVVAVELRPTRVPAGLTTRSQVLLVLVDGDDVFTTTARVVQNLTGGDNGGSAALSVEVPVEDAPAVAAAGDVRIVLIEPGIDAATEPGAGG